jgi:sugar diacid utilization regulator
MIENEDYGVLVVCAAQLRYYFNEALAQLEKYLADRRDRAAVSRRFRSFDMLYDQYRALSSAMQLGMVLDPDRQLYHFDAYSLPVMLKTCSREFDLRVFCTYEAVTLYDYDKSNGSDFFKSLYIYLRHNRSLASAAAELKVHRNTLLYRIGRAAEITGLNPSKDEIILPILLSYEILHYRLRIE